MLSQKESKLCSWEEKREEERDKNQVKEEPNFQFTSDVCPSILFSIDSFVILFERHVFYSFLLSIVLVLLFSFLSLRCSLTLSFSFWVRNKRQERRGRKKIWEEMYSTSSAVLFILSVFRSIALRWSSQSASSLKVEKKIEMTNTIRKLQSKRTEAERVHEWTRCLLMTSSQLKTRQEGLSKDEERFKHEKEEVRNKKSKIPHEIISLDITLFFSSNLFVVNVCLCKNCWRLLPFMTCTTSSQRSSSFKGKGVSWLERTKDLLLPL